jgi:hypothetical protein
MAGEIIQHEGHPIGHHVSLAAAWLLLGDQVYIDDSLTEPDTN